MKKNLLLLLSALIASPILSCNNNKNEQPEPDPIITKGYIIEASRSYLLSDGKDQITFRVYDDGRDVTDSSELFVRSAGAEQRLTQPAYTTSEQGTVKFHATKGNKTSEPTTIEALGVMQSAPEDPKPTQFSDFYKRVLALQLTGTWCPQCPTMIKMIHDYQDKYTGGDVIFGAAHGGSSSEPLLNDGSQTLISWSGTGSYPYLIFNFSKLPKHQTSIGVTLAKMKSIVDQTLEVDAKSAISVVATEQSGKINVRADIKIATNGQYRVSCWLLEDDIFAKQANSTAISGDFIDNHKHVIRATYPHKVPYGALGGKYTHNQGSSYTFCASFDIAESKIANIKKTQVAVVVYDHDDMICDNVVKCEIGSAVTFQYK